MQGLRIENKPILALTLVDPPLNSNLEPSKRAGVYNINSNPRGIQGDARILCKDPMYLRELATICLKPLRIAFDHLGVKKPYEQAIRYAHDFGLTELSNYMLYNFHDGPALPKGHHLFDSFEGLSAPVPQDGSHWQANDLQIDFVNKPNGGLLVLPDATTNSYRELIIALAARYRVPDPDRPASCSRALSIFRRHRIG